MNKTARHVVALALVSVLAAVVSLTYLFPGWYVCHERLSATGTTATVCGPITADDSLLVGIWLLVALLFLLPDLSELVIAGLVTLKTRVDGLAQRQDATERLMALSLQALSLQNSNSQTLSVNFGEQLVQALAREGARLSGSSEDLEVSSVSAARVQEFVEDIQRHPPVNADELAERVVSTIVSLGAVVRGHQDQGSGALTVHLFRPLPDGETVIRVRLDTPGVTFSGPPTIVTNRGVDARSTQEAPNTVAIHLKGPAPAPLAITVAGLALSVAFDAPLGAIRTSLSVGDKPSTVIASIGTIRA